MPHTALAQWLETRGDDYRHSEPLPRPEPLPASIDVYVLSSALQKAVRRSDLAMARRVGHQLLRRDKRRLWNRLAVTALEDIGIGDPDCAAELVGVALDRHWRYRAGGDEATLDVILTAACSAIKDRGADHALSIMALAPPPAARRLDLRRIPEPERLDLVANTACPLDERLFVASTLVGASGRADPSALANVLARLREAGVPETLMNACSLHGLRSRDRLGLALPLIWLEWRHGGSSGHIRQHFLPGQEIGGIPDYAFDPLHTRLGRQSVRLWLRSFLKRPPFTESQVAMALWNREASALARQLIWPTGEQLRDRAHAADLMGTGLPLERHQELREWIDANMKALQPARAAAMAALLTADCPLDTGNAQ